MRRVQLQYVARHLLHPVGWYAVLRHGLHHSVFDRNMLYCTGAERMLTPASAPQGSCVFSATAQ